MNIQEMHSTFRVLGQQMGAQLIRGILPESIDVYINNVIIEKTQQELVNGVRTAFQETVDTQPSTMSPINVFRSLYRTARYKIDVNDTSDGISKISYYNPSNGFHIINIPVVDSKVTLDDKEYWINPMMFLGFSVEYENTLRGNSVACRLIGSDVLETTLRDYCNGASKENPIVCLSSIPVINNQIEQTDAISKEQIELYTNTKDCNIKYLNIKYVKSPNVVKYDIDPAKCVNCDLPIYTHFEIVQRAVYKYFESVGMTSSNPQRQQQRQ